MKSLKSILEASILADIDDQLESGDEVIKQQILEFIDKNYSYSGALTISYEPNKDGKYKVSLTSNAFVKNTNKITSLTNNVFVWHEVGGYFDCSECKSLTSLEGAPQKVGGYFDCSECKSLTSLEGAPEEVEGDFNCIACNSLKSLEGAPKEIGGGFSCENCKSLTSLEGAPKKVGRNFCCNYCKAKFVENDVKKVSNVKGKIYC